MLGARDLKFLLFKILIINQDTLWTIHPGRMDGGGNYILPYK